MNKLLIFSYSILLLCFLFFSYLFIDPGLFYLKFLYSGFIFQNRLLVTVLYIVFISLFFLQYLFTLNLIRFGKLQTRDIFALIALCAGILFISYPAILSFDIFNYIATAKVTFFYHENPYIVMPIEFLHDPLLLFTHASNKIALYGPLWIATTGIPHYLGFNNFLLTLFNFKLFILLFYFGSAFLVWKISKNIVPVAIFALNPLIFIETLASSHNDIVMMFLALLAFFFVFKKKNFYALVFLIGSIFIKYATAFLIPVFLYVIVQNHLNKKIQKEKVFFIATLLMFIPFFFSFLREEIYPWYAIWFLVFTCFIPQRKNLMYLSIALSFGLMLRYVPFMLIGTYFGPTPILKIVLTIIPIVLTFGLLYLFKKNTKI